VSGVSQELGFTATATEVVDLTIVLRTALGGSWVHNDSADGIMGFGQLRSGMALFVASALSAAGPQQQDL
jgi:hypothetical protein